MKTVIRLYMSSSEGERLYSINQFISRSINIILPVIRAVRRADDIREVEEPLAGGEVLGVGAVGPQPLEGDLVLGLLARAARARQLVRLRVLRHLRLAQLAREPAHVHRPVRTAPRSNCVITFGISSDNWADALYQEMKKLMV